MTAPSEPDVRSEIPPNSELKVRSVSCNAKSVLGGLGTPYILAVARLQTEHPRCKTACDHVFGTSLMGISVRIQRRVSLQCRNRLPANCHRPSSIPAR